MTAPEVGSRRPRGPLARLPLPTSFVPSGPSGSSGPSGPRQGRHRGQGLSASVVDIGVYVEGRRLDTSGLDLDQCVELAQERRGFTWVGLHAPDAAALQTVADRFGLHPLAVEDAVHAHQRPKLETYGDTLLFVVLKTVRYVDHEEVIDTGELMVFVGPDSVVTVRHGEAAELASVRTDLEARPELLSVGPAAVLYAVVDRVVDGYGPAALAVEEDVDEIEDQVFGQDQASPTERIYKLKREVMAFRRAVDPLTAVTGSLAGGEVRCLAPSTADYFRDVHDHTVRAAELVGSMAELLDSVLASNLAQVTLRQNEDMRKISAWVAIAAVCTLVAGVYGMNFTHMPELSWTYGYPYALGLMVVASVGLWLGFKKNHWL